MRMIKPLAMAVGLFASTLALADTQLKVDNTQPGPVIY